LKSTLRVKLLLFEILRNPEFLLPVTDVLIHVEKLLSASIALEVILIMALLGFLDSVVIGLLEGILIFLVCWEIVLRGI